MNEARGETTGEAYDRGHTAGGVDAQLAEHSQHLAKINGSIERFAGEVHGLRLDIQGLKDEVKANARAVPLVAAALKDADEARRAAGESSWSPWAKIFAAIGGLAAFVGVVTFLVSKVG
jgi:hypothetical protein